jgi:hypothetical protein
MLEAVAERATDFEVIHLHLWELLDTALALRARPV